MCCLNNQLGSANKVPRTLLLKCERSVKFLLWKGWMETDDRGFQKIYVIWYSFCILGKSFARPFEINQIPSLDHVLPKTKIISFWFWAMKNDWVWRRVFQSFMNILNISVKFTGVLFFQRVSIFEKLDSKFENVLTE